MNGRVVWPSTLPATGSITFAEDLNTWTAAFPSFNNELREAISRPVRFIEDVIRNDRSVSIALRQSHLCEPALRHMACLTSRAARMIGSA
jgi:hypothetical protein